MRKFSIKNEKGEVVPLNGENGIRFVEPQGLGIAFPADHFQLGDGFWKKTISKKYPASKITGNLVFTRSTAYQDLREFARWAIGSKKLALVYDAGDEYVVDTAINMFSKTEKGAGGFLSVGVAFDRLTPWMKESPLTLMIVPEGTTEGKRYPYTYPYTYTSGRSGSTVDIMSSGDVDGAFALKIAGALDNPSIILSNTVTNDIVGKCSILGTVPSGAELELSTIEGNVYCRIGGVNAIDLLDINNNNFPKIPANTRCTLSITAENTITQTAVLRIYSYFLVI